MDIFDRTRETAKRQGMNLRTLAERAELSPNSIYNWRRSNPKSENVEAVAKVLNVSVDYLLGNTTDSRRTGYFDVFENAINAFYQYANRIEEHTDENGYSVPGWLEHELTEKADQIVLLAENMQWSSYKEFYLELIAGEFYKSKFVNTEMRQLADRLDFLGSQQLKEEKFVEWTGALKASLDQLRDVDKEKVLNKLEDYAQGLVDAYKD